MHIEHNAAHSDSSVVVWTTVWILIYDERESWAYRREGGGGRAAADLFEGVEHI